MGGLTTFISTSSDLLLSSISTLNEANLVIITTVADGFQEDYGKSIGRIPEESFKKINLEIGEIIEIINGDRKIGVFLRPIEEILDHAIPQTILYSKKPKSTLKEDEDILLHINGFIRASLKIGLGQKVHIDKTSVPDAEKVLIAALNPEYREKVFIDYITNRPIIRGQIIELQNIGFDLKVGILTTSPPGIVRIGALSDVRLSHETPKVLMEDTEDIVMWDDFGGNKQTLTRLRSLVEYPLRYPEIFSMLNIHPPQGILITGPAGIGKTYLSKAIAYESGVTRFFVMAPEIVKGWWTTEKEMDKYFQHVSNYEPAILILDQIEVLAPAPAPNLSDLEMRMTEQLIRNLDRIKGKQIIVIGTTTNADSIHPALRAYGRFEIEISLKIPNFDDRVEILSIHTRGMPLEEVDIKSIAQATGGYSPADLELLVKEAGMHALERKNLLELELNVTPSPQVVKQTLGYQVNINNDDFLKALATVKPSASREVISEVPKVTWQDIGGLENVQQSLKEMIQWPIEHSNIFKEMGIRSPRGVLLYGPPGTGKTLLAKALANEIQANFLVVKGPELLSKWFAESARMVRDLFSRAKQLAPCIIFFDEIDALATKRGGSYASTSSKERDRIINQLLASLDGVDKMKGVYVVGATNRPNAIDPALLRPGRLDRLIYVPVPAHQGRFKILKVHTRNMPLGDDVDLEQISKSAMNYTGADLENLCREAAYASLRRDSSSRIVTKDDFNTALGICRSSVNSEIIKFYQMQDGEMKKHRTSDYMKLPQEFI